MLKNRTNISSINALLRIACGLSMLSILTAKMVRRPWKQSYVLLAIMSAFKVAEGIVRFCPMTALYCKGRALYDDMLSDMGTFDFGMDPEDPEDPEPLPSLDATHINN
ncbi:YgaP family membrane protein [Bacillus testis]|uniref:YgaP family membrane protein n=1 Tax=Bacillus testis TaxID=1622072 RepID=UPI0008411756|nr:YgaP-like transmembrane domain [Bacillus testis]